MRENVRDEMSFLALVAFYFTFIRMIYYIDIIYYIIYIGNQSLTLITLKV